MPKRKGSEVSEKNPSSRKKTKKRQRTYTTKKEKSVKQDVSFYFQDLGPDHSCNLIIEGSLNPPDTTTRTISAPFERRHEPPRQNVAIGVMSPKETAMWSSTLGAHYAARVSAPGNLCRKLGTITRTLFWNSSKEPMTFKLRGPKGSRQPVPPFGGTRGTLAPPSKAKVEKEARILQQRQPNCLVNVPEKGREILKDWKDSIERNGFITPNWNCSGELPCVSYGSDRTAKGAVGLPNIQKPTMICLTTVLSHLKSRKLTEDPSEQQFRNLYHLEIPTDAQSVLQALKGLATPDDALYKCPLVVPMLVVEPLSQKRAEKIPFQLTIHVYAHRLLFECMTEESLRTVMTALDDNDYTVEQPLIDSPSNGPIVFGKDPNTKVDMEAKDEYGDADEGNGIVDLISLDSYEDNARTRKDDTLDAFSTEGFLHLIENQGVAGVETVYKTQIEPLLYNGGVANKSNSSLLQVSLLPHQIHGVCWMYQMEHLGDSTGILKDCSRRNEDLSLGLNGLLWERRRFREGDDYFFSPALGQARLTVTKSPRGGILADEMGLGKTVQAIALVLATLNEVKQEAAETNKKLEELTNKDEFWASHATLIIVPPALVGQWMNEIRKIAGSNMKVQFLDHKNCEDLTSLQLDTSADVVLTTYQALESKNWKGSRKMAATAVTEVLLSTIWGRIVLDEMQEVRSWNSVVSKKCQELRSDRRWMLSGTPLWEGIQDFKGELCFLGLEPFAASNEDGFFDFAIANHWEARSKSGLEILRILALVMLRRTKSMIILETGMPLLGLKDLNLIFEPVPQDPSERALYCFLEFVLHTTMESSKEEMGSANTAITRKNNQNKLQFLRLLRELCVSPYLINGGLGCNAQLKALNRLMVDYNRKRLSTLNSDSSCSENNSKRTYSCDEAIQFLSQVQDTVRTDSDFVTDQRMGGGGGISRRNRALLMVSPRERVAECKVKIARSKEVCRLARSKRARARWHWALECVTTGQLKGEAHYDRVSSPSLVEIWKWRSKLLDSKEDGIVVISSLRRGFRPTSNYFAHNESEAKIGETSYSGRMISTAQKQREQKLTAIYKHHPEFRWAYPFTLVLSMIPKEISEPKMRVALRSSFCPPSKSAPEVSLLRTSEDSTTWEALVKFKCAQDFDLFETNVKRVDGIQLEQITESIPIIEEEIAVARAQLEEANAMKVVHPCPQNERNLAKAKAAYEKATLGIRILMRESHRQGQILCSRFFGNMRGSGPKTSDTLFSTIERQVNAASDDVIEHMSIVERENKTLKSMERRIEMNTSGSAVENLNTFDSLQALKNGNKEKTCCPICTESLGEGENEMGNSNGKVLLTRCGHLSCRACLSKWIAQKEENDETISCIECRKPIVRGQLICIDPKKKDLESCNSRKKEARSLVQQAAEMLERNYGQLDPHLWEALYLVIDLPNHVNRSLDESFTAIPGLFLGHLRHLLGAFASLNSAPSAITEANSRVYLPSKFRALMDDLPRDELSVVFASSKSIVLHLECVLQREGFENKALFVGQSERDSESAIADWESQTDPSKVLIVQAGAAACGLTLTKSSKLFIIEPFRKHEEEKQAYARLHRYGQTRAVHCKVYYSPVSVESRLLEWRRRANAHTSQEEKTVYASIRLESGQDNEDNDVDFNKSDEEIENVKETSGEDRHDVEDENQTRFLLGLSSSAPPSAASTEESSDDDSVCVLSM